MQTNTTPAHEAINSIRLVNQTLNSTFLYDNLNLIESLLNEVESEVNSIAESLNGAVLAAQAQHEADALSLAWANSNLNDANTRIAELEVALANCTSMNT